jgi:hypothetical protein
MKVALDESKHLIISTGKRFLYKKQTCLVRLIQLLTNKWYFFLPPFGENRVKLLTLIAKLSVNKQENFLFFLICVILLHVDRWPHLNTFQNGKYVGGEFLFTMTSSAIYRYIV